MTYQNNNINTGSNSRIGMFTNDTIATILVPSTTNTNNNNRSLAAHSRPSKFSGLSTLSYGSQNSSTNSISTSSSSSQANHPYRASPIATSPTIAAVATPSSSGTESTVNSSNFNNNNNSQHSISNSSSSNGTFNYSDNSNDDLESKLHSTAASFRKTRDEAHRGYTILQERLRLVTEEHEQVQKSITYLQQHLQSSQQTYTNDQSKHVELQKEIQQLSNEVRFQHAELVSKRNQLQDQRMTGPLSKSATAERQELLHKLNQTLQFQRDKLQSTKTNRDRSGQVGLGMGATTGSSQTKSLHRTVLVELWNEMIPEGQVEVPTNVVRRWIRTVEDSTSHLRQQLQPHNSNIDDEVTKLKFLAHKYDEFILQNNLSPDTVVNHRHFGTPSTTSNSDGGSSTTSSMTTTVDEMHIVDEMVTATDGNDCHSKDNPSSCSMLNTPTTSTDGRINSDDNSKRQGMHTPTVVVTETVNSTAADHHADDAMDVQPMNMSTQSSQP